MKTYELNLDGLVGPSHHYAGLAPGNMASTQNALTLANPAAAAKQGLAKMRLLHQMGLQQALLPPHQRPNLHLLHALGFSGTPAEQVRKAKHASPALLGACYSASSMWTANAATVSASADTLDRKVHFTAANLVSHLHRHQEVLFSARLLRAVFPDPSYFKHHAPLPGTSALGDEGAANHSRLCAAHVQPGVSLFVYGKQGLGSGQAGPVHFPARQTLEASMAIARQHQLTPGRAVFACQNPQAIDLGVFHNDVIAVANENLFLLHEQAFVNQREVLAELRQKVECPLTVVEIPEVRLSVSEAVASYLFNSQLVTLPEDTATRTMALIAPAECAHQPRVKAVIDELLASCDNPLSQVYFLDLKQSMRNGGGPACLRLRVPLTQMELAAMHQGVRVTDKLLEQLERWVGRHYRDRLRADDLDDPVLIEEGFTALDELTQLLQLGSLYPFQRETQE